MQNPLSLIFPNFHLVLLKNENKISIETSALNINNLTGKFVIFLYLSAILHKLLYKNESPYVFVTQYLEDGPTAICMI